MSEAERLYEYHEHIAICVADGISELRAEEIARQQLADEEEKNSSTGITEPRR